MGYKRYQLNWALVLPLILALVSLGCGLTTRLASLRGEPELPPTRTPLPTYTPTATSAAFIPVDVIEAAAQATEVALEQNPPTPTPEPTQTPTATPAPTQEPAAEAVSVTILQDMNVRGGPGTNYPIVGPGPAGSTAPVIGRNDSASWLQVEYPPGSGGTGWVFAELVQVSGDPQTVAVAEAPPAPAPVAAAPAPQPEAAPAEEAPPAEPPPPQYQFTPTGWFASENAAIVQFKGRIKDEGGNLVNGFSVYVSNGAWGTISHPTGASHWYPDKGDGEWDVTGIPLFDAQGWWWLSVVRYDCNFWGGFDSQCKEFTRFSEEVKIQVKTPEESIINADWICHWDCDKGLYVQAFRR